MIRTSLRNVDANAGALMNDPVARQQLQQARSTAERQVANALRVAEGILAQHG
jgi:hypothetical protein